MNGKVFRGYPTTAAAREGCAEVAELLVRAGASQPACEEAIVEAALQGQAALAATFMRSDLVRPRIAVHALVSSTARGFVDVVDTLVKVCQCLHSFNWFLALFFNCYTLILGFCCGFVQFFFFENNSLMASYNFSGTFSRFKIRSTVFADPD